MNIFMVFPYYFSWHYGLALHDLWDNAKRSVIFVYHFFSIDILFTHLFSPWRRISESNGQGASLESIFESFVVNTLMRFVGFFIRAAAICIGIIGIVVTTFFAILTFLFWILLPAVIVYSFWWGILKII